jgi:N-acetylglutamate synthase-like GNAT family acetyltransferase
MLSEMRLLLEPARVELVRSFVREVCLCEGVSLTAAGLLAEETSQAWRALCTLGSGHERARIRIRFSGSDVSSQVILPGHSRFSKIAECLIGRLRADTGIAWCEHGIDAWEVCVHRGLADQVVPAQAIAAEGSPPAAAPSMSQCSYTIELAQRSDAPAIARCFLAVYGHAYVHPEVFSPRRYWDKVERGELIAVVARDGEGEVVGHLALERGPGTQVAERGEAVVLPAHRSHGLLEGMTERLSQEAVKYDLQGIYAEPVTIHTYSQRNDEHAGMPVCAVLLGVNPATFHPKEMSSIAEQRQSYLRTFRFVRPPAPRTIYAPAPYRKILHKLYERLGVSVPEPAMAGSAAQQSRTSIKVNGRGYGMIAFEQIGSSAAIELAQALRDAQALGACSVQLSACLEDPGLPLLTDAARDLGFFFCGLGPAFADGRDLFLLQLLYEPLDTGKLQLFTDLTKELVAFIDSDRKIVAGGRGTKQST